MRQNNKMRQGVVLMGFKGNISIKKALEDYTK